MSEPAETFSREQWTSFFGVDSPIARMPKAEAAFFSAIDLAPIDWMTIRDLMTLGKLDEDRPLLVVLALLFAAMAEGSLCLELTRAHVGRLAAGSRGLPAFRHIFDTIDTFIAHLADNRYHRLITTRRSNRYPLVFESGAGTQRLYFQKYFFHEKRLHDTLRTFLAADPPADISSPAGDAIVADLFSDDHVLRLGRNGHPIVRDPDQIAALRRALDARLTIISGGPGTGKTSVMVNIVRGLARAGIPARRMALVAPTGRAARRMTEAITRLLPTVRRLTETDRDLLSLSGSTLHKALRYSRYHNGFYYRRRNPLPADAVIIDEVSMVDVVMLARFLDALDTARTRLILIGDKDQLPSVEAGAVFAEMIPSGDRAGLFKDHLIVLKKNYRAGTALSRLAAAINHGRFPDAPPMDFQAALTGPDDGWAVVRPLSDPHWQTCLRHWVNRYFLSPPGAAATPAEGYRHRLATAGKMAWQDHLSTAAGRETLRALFALIGRAKILTLLRQGNRGCEGINAIVEHFLARGLGSYRDPVSGLFSGSVIMMTRNDYDRGLFNGDIGLALRDNGGRLRVCFQQTDGYQSYSADQLPAWEPAFAVTVHKSQGSEFDDVLIVLPEDVKHRLLTREIIYTGITRARRRVMIYGRRSTIETAISHRLSRQSGLVWDDPPGAS